MLKKTWPLFVFALCIALFWAGGYQEYLTVDRLLSEKAALQGFITGNSVLSLMIFAGIYAVIVALSLPFASFMTMAAGFLFGLYAGVITVVIAATLGATAVFYVAKSAFGDFLRKRAGSLYRKTETEMRNNAASYLLFLRLVPIFPFFLVNIMPALFNIRASTYIWTTALGILPGTAVYVNVGRSLGQVENPADLVSADVILSIAMLGVVALIPVFYKKLRRNPYAQG